MQANTKSGNFIVAKSGTENTSNNERTFAADLSACMANQFRNGNEITWTLWRWIFIPIQGVSIGA
jgi:hypothetical protein